MRILHVSHGAIPDSRIEKVAEHFRRQGHEILFFGLKKSGNYRGPFKQVFVENSLGMAKVLFDKLTQKRYRDKIVALNPDLVHFHDLICTAFLYKIDRPIIFDDHECLSRQLSIEPCLASRRKSQLLRVMLYELYRRDMRKKETDIINKHPTIVTNNRVKKAYKKRGARWVGVVENFPALWQLEHINYDKYGRDGVVYAGRDSLLSRPSPHRNMKGLCDFVKYDVIYNLSHQDMMQELTKYRFGIVGWKYSPVLDFKNQNKGYEYMHAGCQMIISEQLAWQYKEGLPWIHTFKNYNEIPSIVENASDIDPLEIVAYARQHHLWESRSQVYEEAYRRAMM